MCRRVVCATCAKPGWSGCGAHIEDVLDDVAVADRCSCSEGPTKSPGFLARLFGAK